MPQITLLLSKKTVAVALISLACSVFAAGAARADWLTYEDLENSIDLRVWANDGGEKIPREILRSYSQATNETTLNSVWDGSDVSIFGARNEIVSFAVVVDNNGAAVDGLTADFSTLTDTSGSYTLETTNNSVNSMYHWTNRPIEVFVIDYLRIHGLSKISYPFDDETHIPEQFRRPIPVNIQPLAPAVGSGVWQDRPHHDLSYPDIAVPQEIKSANGGLTVNPASSQIFWIDIYIPKNAPAGILSGAVSISLDGTEAISVPVEVEVLGFELPDERHSKTMVYIESADIKERYFTGIQQALSFADEQAYRDVVNRHFQLAWRHGISLFDANDLLPDQVPDVLKPNVDWIKRLDGDFYKASSGYAGPGQNLKHDIYVVGSYGAWSFWWDLRQYNPISSTYDPNAPVSLLQSTLETNTASWENWFQNNSPDTTRIFYVDDEPAAAVSLEYAELIAGLVENSPLAGSQLDTLITANSVNHGASLPSAKILSSLITVGDTDSWDQELLSNPDRIQHLYNGRRPASGTFATEDDGIALRELPWGQYKKDIDRWFYWHATYYRNSQGGAPQRDLSQVAGGEGESYRIGSHTNVFKSAHTFGGHQAGFDPVRGETGFNYGNGDGVLFYPGTDLVFPSENLNLAGPMASLRLKHWRRGIQDVQYIEMAMAVDATATQALINAMVPEVMWELGVRPG